MRLNDGGPAFPADIQRRDPVTSEWGELPPQGMTLRDWFAGQALAHCDFCHRLPSQVNEESAESQKRLVTEYRRIVAEQCYDMADAMIKAREQPADAGKGVEK